MFAAASSGLVVALVLSVFLHTVHIEGGKNVVCYYANWPQYRPGDGKYVVSNIDPFSCTHMVFAFAKLQGNTIAAYEYNDRTPNGGMYKQLNDLKRINPSLKTLLAVGGWSHGPELFATMAATPQNRHDFIINSMALLRQYNFDGLDLDWEYPVQKDKHNLALLVKEIRAAYENEATQTNRKRLMITMATAASIERAKIAYEFSILDDYVDMYNVMTYDYHGAWENKPASASPMNSHTDELAVTNTIEWYIRQGASRAKINLGMAFYARTWTLVNPSQGKLSLASGAGTPGTYTREKGVLAYYEVCEMQKKGLRPMYDPVSQTMYSVYGNQFITFENQQTIRVKLTYLTSMGLGGAMIWALDLDDFTGKFCYEGTAPLVSLINSTMAVAKNPAILPTLPPINPSTGTTQTTPTTTTTTQPQTTPRPVDDTTVTKATTRPTQKPFTCPREGGYVRDPQACNSYYLCLRGGFMMQRFTCRGGNQVFNPHVNMCEPRATSSFQCVDQ